MHQYELLLLLTPDNSEEDVDAYLSELESQLDGVTFHEKDFWGKRTLAQEVEDYTEGVYVVTRLTGGPKALQEMESLFRMNQKILRFLLLKIKQRHRSRFSPSRKNRQQSTSASSNLNGTRQDKNDNEPAKSNTEKNDES